MIPAKTAGDTFAFGVAILAAGKSSRMGRPKLLLPWGETTILGHLIGQWEKLDAKQIAVVCAVDTQAIQAVLDCLSFPEENMIRNPAPDRGMFSSIRCAATWAGWKPELTHWIITLGDQPHLRPETMRILLDFGTSHPGKICQPLRQGHRRHPVLLPRNVFLKLSSTTARDLKEFLQSMSADLAGWESDDAGLDFDIDEPADYKRALRFAATSI
jgi:molybdenum cofactor cytidylyltransferase